MRFGGFLKHSLIDFPGTVAGVVFTQGCNFLCPYCHNPELVPARRETGPDPKDILSFLETRQGLLDGVVISGGEPCLQPDLEAFITRVRTLGFRVKLDTNGSCPGVLARLLSSGLLDYVAMDIKTDPDQYPTLMTGNTGLPDRIRRSIALIMAGGVDYEFRTTCVRPFLDTPNMDAVADLVAGARRWILQPCIPHPDILSPGFLDPAHERILTESEIQSLARILAPRVTEIVIR